MKHATSRMLFAYWDALRGERAAPERGDVQPGAMRHVLADAFILAAEPRQGAVFRLAGTRISSLFGRELRGRPFHSLWPVERQDEADGLVSSVLNDTLGLVAGAVAFNENGSELPVEVLLLPLRHRGRPESRLLGALSPNLVPSWAGLVPIRSIETRSLRIIQPRASSAGSPQGETRGFAAERRSLFVVHEGGRP